VPASTGWFVMNARDARRFDRPGRDSSLPLIGSDEYEAQTFFPMLGMSIQVLSPGEPNATYHWETEQERTGRFPPSQPTRYRDGWLPG
jgi:hypothetical protein